MYRFDTLSACSTFLLTLLALYTNVSPGLTAFVLIAASQCEFYVLDKEFLAMRTDYTSPQSLHQSMRSASSMASFKWTLSL